VALLLAGCEAAVGEARRGDTPLRPVGEQLTQALSTAAFPWTPPASETTGAITQTAGGSTGNAETTSVRVAAGGTGISLRSDCTEAARSGGAWTDNTQVTVVEYGSGRCAGWTRASTGGTMSWIRDEYLDGLPPAGQRSNPVAPAVTASPRTEQLHVWTVKILDAAGRVALLSRHAPESMEAASTATFLGHTRDGMHALAAEITATGPSGVAVCNGARRPLIEAANALADLAQRMQPVFSDGADPPSGLDALVTRYASAQSDAGRLIADCARA
jgi:hypothetical protein